MWLRGWCRQSDGTGPSASGPICSREIGFARSNPSTLVLQLHRGAEVHDLKGANYLSNLDEGHWDAPRICNCCARLALADANGLATLDLKPAEVSMGTTFG